MLTVRKITLKYDPKAPKAIPNSAVSYRVTDITTSLATTTCFGAGLVWKKLGSLEELNARFDIRDGHDFMQYVPRELLPHKDVLMLLQNAGVLADMFDHVENIVFCSHILTKTGSEYHAPEGLSFATYFRARNTNFSNKNIYFNLDGLKNGKVDPITLVRVVSHETGHLKYKNENGIEDKLLSEIFAYNYERNAMLKLYEYAVKTAEMDAQEVKEQIKGAHERLIEGLTEAGMTVADDIKQDIENGFEIEVDKRT